jgi:hypothetical protein
MDCPNLRRLSDLLEEGLPPAEKVALERHLAVCPGCETALAARRRLIEAAASLPDLEVPFDFAASVLARLETAPAPARRRFPLAARLAVAASAVSVVGLALVLAGGGLPAFLRLNAALWGSIRSAAQVLGKGLKVLVLAGKLILQFSSQALAAFRTITSLIGPEAQAAIVGAAVLILLAGGFVLRRRSSYAERSHEDT